MTRHVAQLSIYRRLSESYRDERFVVRHTLNPLELITVGGFSVNEFEGLNSVSIELDATVSGTGI